MWKSSIFNASDRRKKEYTCGVGTALAPLCIQVEMHRKSASHTGAHQFYCWSFFSFGEEWRKEGRGWGPKKHFLSNSYLLCSEQEDPFVLNYVLKNKQTNKKHIEYHRGILSSGISCQRKNLRPSNLIHVGPLCLNPQSKVFNQAWRDGGRQLGLGSWDTGLWVEGREVRKWAEICHRDPSLPQRADQALLLTSLQECKAALVHGSFQDGDNN